ncbi:MAG: patatin-like phospholipase family protein [Cyanobacteria bacterium P01_C01_bin.70]
MTEGPPDLPREEHQSPQIDLPEDLRAANIKIALALSGGGYRAAAFHLGILSYLQHIKLLPNLDRLSTVSGGTFTGAKYILSLVENRPFSAFFNDFCTFLNKTNLIKQGLEDLNQESGQELPGGRKLITSLANVYARTFLADSKDRPYTFGQILDADNIGVTEISFNATEFRTGLAFRFQKTFSKGARIGNGNVFIDREDAKKIRLADIVAASSCFPGGFEPLAFPQDFKWPDQNVLARVTTAMAIPPDQQPKYSCGTCEESEAPVLTNTVALMDGGIYDNQGIGSLLLADGRKSNGLPDLIIISDTDPTDDNIFPYPKKTLSSGWLTLKHVNWLIYGALITCFTTVVSSAFSLWSEVNQGTFDILKDFFPAFMPLVLSGLVTGTILYSSGQIRKLLKQVPNLGLESWQDLKTLKVNQFIYIMSLRVTSMSALIRQVFMKRIRSLVLNQPYDNPIYDEALIMNRIDRLLTDSIDNVPHISGLENRLRTVINSAACMPTTLWFDAKNVITIQTATSDNKRINELDSLVIAGQTTICFNLLQYITNVYGRDPQVYPEKIHGLWQDLRRDWQKLNANPCVLIEALKNL